jgi:hypothetical protein
MTEDQCIKIAQDYLSSHAIEHVRPGQIGSKEQGARSLGGNLPQSSCTQLGSGRCRSTRCTDMGHGPERTGGIIGQLPLQS